MSGAPNCRPATREEILRMFRESAWLHGDETPVSDMSAADIDLELFQKVYQEISFGEPLDLLRVDLPTLLNSMNLATKDGVLNVAGALTFSNNPSFRLPAFIVKAVAFPGDAVEDLEYIDSRDITGKVSEMFHRTIGFIASNLKRPQGDQGVNSIGEWEIPRIVFEELVANALIHRDYFISSPVRVLIFRNRIEIISPGHLPNNLTVENIKNGNSNMRNPILASFASRILPYRGIGSGVRRALHAYPDIEFDDDREGNKFTVTILRK